MNHAFSETMASKMTAKKKAKALSDALVGGTLKPSALMQAAPTLTDADLATVLESLESSTRKKPELVDSRLFTFLLQCLVHAAPRVRWEAARTVGNVAGQRPTQLEQAVDALLVNTQDDSTVVRWATAQALASILRAGYTGKDLPARMFEIMEQEDDDGVRGVYRKALAARR